MLGDHRCALALLADKRVRSILVVAAHPDDETIGIGATLGSVAALGVRVHVLHVTDGAPKDAALRAALRDRSTAEAAAVRRAEAALALRVGGLDPSIVLAESLGVPDQEAAFAMTSIARSIARRLHESPVDLVVTHPYEGGHPDHDAVAFAVHAALRLLPGAVVARDHEIPCLAEMSSYHGQTGTLVAARFLPSTDATHVCDARHEGLLDDAARARKREMLDAHATQLEALEPFEVAREPLRCAPTYDFTQAPHGGTLHYERLPFGWTGERWRELARAASQELGLT